MSNAIAIILSIALAFDALANVARIIGVVLGLRQQAWILKHERADRDKTAQEIIDAINKAQS